MSRRDQEFIHCGTLRSSGPAPAAIGLASPVAARVDGVCAAPPLGLAAAGLELPWMPSSSNAFVKALCMYVLAIRVLSVSTPATPSSLSAHNA